MMYFETESELNAFEKGKKYTKVYIQFCTLNYVHKMNFSGITEYFFDLADFLKGKKDYIPNTFDNLTFEQFCERYSLKEG